MLENMNTLKYLGRMVSFDDSYQIVVNRNLQRAWMKWVRSSRLLCVDGVDTRTSGRFYVEVVQFAMLLGLGSLVFTPRILQTLGSFHNLVARSNLGRMPRRQNGQRYYPLIGEELAQAGMVSIGEYIS